VLCRGTLDGSQLGFCGPFLKKNKEMMSFGILVGEIPAVFNVELYVETLQFQEK